MFGYPHLRRRSLGVVATLSLTAAIAAGCGGSDTTTTATTAPAAGSTGTATTMPASTMQEMTTTAAAGKPGFNDAVDLRVTLNRLLGEHMQIAVDATQTALLGGKASTPRARTAGQHGRPRRRRSAVSTAMARSSVRQPVERAQRLLRELHRRHRQGRRRPASQVPSTA